MGIITFGTSGWRGVMAEEFTVANVRRAVIAIATYLRSAPGWERGVVVGYDTRFFSDRFAGVAADLLSQHGIEVFLSHRDVPTPTVAHGIIHRKAAGGINFTASHNPPEYNGLKFSGEDGGSAMPEVTRVIERLAESVDPEATVPPGPRGSVQTVDLGAPYREKLWQLVEGKVIRRARLKVVVDPLYGPSRGYLDALLAEMGAKVVVIHGQRDVLYGGHPPDPSRENLAELGRAVLENKADLGVATDGDADRFGIVDGDGKFLDPNHLLALIYRHLWERRGMRGGVGRSIATTHLLDALAQRYGEACHETPVGFRYLGQLISDGKILFGGEESAGCSMAGHVPEKDGILACLLAAEIRATEGRSLHSVLAGLFDEVGGHYPLRVNLPLTPSLREGLSAKLASPPGVLDGRRVVQVQRLDGVKLVFEGGSWILFRPSGTEPVVRLYVEAFSEAEQGRLVRAARSYLAA